MTVISFLNSRANAIKILQSRISLLKSYLHQLPPSYLTDASIPVHPNASAQSQGAEISHPVLRSILALTSRLPHVLPADTDAFLKAQAAERSDVAIVSMLGTLGRSVSEAKNLGRTFNTVENSRSVGKKIGRTHDGAADFGDLSYADNDTLVREWDMMM
jgi:COP9 signalosome complex subunit 6